jgi:predicted NBD/HSP70 family sugar kinase
MLGLATTLPYSFAALSRVGHQRSTIRGWSDVDLSALTAKIPESSQVRFLVGNDATLGGLAEARTGAARTAHVALHLLVAVGLGGTILIDGLPVTGAHGAAGEFGHMPFGDPALPCPCGAHGCWDLMIDGRAMARHRGDDPPSDPVAYATRLLDSAQAGTSIDPRDQRAVRLVAQALGAGIAALVNMHDPDIVTIAGLAPAIRAAAPESFATAYDNGLMAFHRRQPPPVHDSAHEADGAIRGAAALAIDAITNPEELESWAAALNHV